ncbi:hypothetical protein ABW19_dt0201497 [Dactylella cylindrospora]|nr:hypothetical protein ABW19_dt0201497 [Dactylella cylindrospora]
MLTESEKQTIEAVQRASSVLSILGASFIIITFLASSRFQKPINRLAFYAAIANILCTIATSIARAGPRAGQGSALCNMQGLFIQTFLQSDALFIAFMALNVYLTVKCKFGSAQLRKLEPYYVAAAFGLPGISGFVFLFVREPGKGPIYGDATMWCWISKEYDVLRLATFYGPVWITILVTFILYAVAGKVVFRMRNDLRRFDKINGGQGLKPSSSQTELSIAAAPAGQAPVNGIHMTTVTQIDVKDDQVDPSRPIGCTYLAGENEPYQYTVTIEAGPHRTHSIADNDIVDYEESAVEHVNEADTEGFVHARTTSIGSGSTHSSTDKKPSMTTVTSATVVSTAARPPVINRNAIAANRRTMKANAAAWAYTRCSFLFFVGLIITWLPSSTNRVYGFIHPEDQPFALYLTASLVLPAQGLWNFVIYVTTSWKSCKLMWQDISIHFSSGLLRKKTSIESLPRDRFKLPSA